MKRVIFLGLGIALTVVFLVLSQGDGYIWEQLMYFGDYNNQMYNLSLYSTLGWITVLVPWAAAAVYYYVINSVKFDRWYHWLAVLGVVAVLTPVVCYIVNDAVFAGAGLQYIGESIQFEFQTMLFAAVMYVIASFSIRWWSTNCRHTPIPQ